MRRHTQRKPTWSRIGLRKQEVLTRIDPDSAMRATIVFQRYDKGSVSFGVDISEGHVRPAVLGRGDDECAYQFPRLHPCLIEHDNDWQHLVVGDQFASTVHSCPGY